MWRDAPAVSFQWAWPASNQVTEEASRCPTPVIQAISMHQVFSDKTANAVEAHANLFYHALGEALTPEFMSRENNSLCYFIWGSLL